MVYTNLKELIALVAQWKGQGQRVVFTNGVFDILHIGHVTYLGEAKSQGDKLVVGINSDASVKRLDKGPDRPINQESARAGVVDALRCVDAVIIFGEDTPMEIIAALVPEVLVKGGDYSPEVSDPADKRYIVGSDVVRAAGGSVVAIDMVEGYSTTAIVNRMKGN